MFQIAFEILDINGDGVIRLEEWKAHSAAVRVPPEWVEATFDAIDKDGDGKITKKEFIDYQLEFFFSIEDKLNSANHYGMILKRHSSLKGYIHTSTKNLYHNNKTTVCKH